MDDARHEGSIASKEVSENSKSTIEINIKTLDSQVYKFHISKDMSVPTLKLKVAEVAGIPVEQQRLIFKGKVLKDDHLISAYHLEDGDALHLVARQPAQAQQLPASSSADPNRSSSTQGNDSMSNASRNRVSQISHSVVMGPVNIEDQGEGLVANIGRVVGAVMQSLGGGLSTPGSNNIASAGSGSQGQPTVVSWNQSGNQGQPTVVSWNQSGNQGQPPVAVVNQPFQVPQVAPTTGSVPRTMVVPDSLTTLLDFINRMELVLHNAGSQSSAPNNTQDLPRSQNLSSQLGRLPTPEMLALAIEHARQLLCGNVASAFSRIIERLRQDTSYSDATLRSQIQAETIHMGVVMHHVGAMLLELGRTTMMLRMGPSHGASFVNSGPAAYISSIGPNPIMVQPSIPQQRLLPIASNPLHGGLSAPFGGVDLLRNINIHVLSGASLANRATSGAPNSSSDGSRGQPENVEQPSQNSNESGATSRQGVPTRAVAADIPARSTTETANHALNVVYPVHARSQETSIADPVPSQGSVSIMSSGNESNLMAVSNFSSALASHPETTQISSNSSGALSGALSYSPVVYNLQQGSPTMYTSSPSDVSFPSTQNLSAGGTPLLVGEANKQIENVLPTGNQSQSSSLMSMQSSLQVSNNDSKNVLKSESLDAHLKDGKAIQVLEEDIDYPTNVDSNRSLDLETSSSNNITSSSNNIISCNTAARSTDNCSTSSLHKSSEKISENSGTSEGSSSNLDNERPAPLGLGLGGLQPKKRSKSTKSVVKDGTSQVTSAANQSNESYASGQQILQSLASRASGTRSDPIGSSRPLPSSIGQIMNGLSMGREGGMAQLDIGNMMSQVLQNPSVNNLLTNLTEQTGMGSLSDFSENGQARVGQNLGNMLLGSGRGQGGFDISRMIQQMMPVVAQAIDSISTQSSGSAIGSEVQQRNNMSGVISPQQRMHRREVEIDLHEACKRIERRDIPRNIFCAVLESTEQLYEGDTYADLVRELVNDAELGKEYGEMLLHHIEKRLENHHEPQ